MENIKIRLNDVAEYDRRIKSSLPEGGDIAFITKDAATESGRAGVMISFTVELPGGGKAIAQAVTTVKLLRGVLAGIAGRYDDEGYLNVENPFVPRVG
jgi:hypothetical protein